MMCARYYMLFGIAGMKNSRVRSGWKRRRGLEITVTESGLRSEWGPSGSYYIIPTMR